jgi:membrane protein DedA with SNARE-associated domain
VIFRDQLRELEKLAYGGAFLIMLISNATVILPVPGLVVVYSLGSTLNPLLVGLFAGPGAALGELTGYAAGYGGSAVIDDMKLYQTIKKWMDRYGAIVITLLASFPNPVFDMVGIVAGSVRMKWWRFLIAVWIGKTIQCILIAYAGYLSLGWIQNFMTK